MKMKMLFFIALVMPSLATAQTVFLSQGHGYYCYQTYDEALASAKTDADKRAQSICKYQRAWRMSDYRVAPKTPSPSCHVLVQAQYLCR
ncbi:MAG: hypothetical protein AABY64_00400 [Bdellovibrionota bacterium]